MRFGVVGDNLAVLPFLRAIVRRAGQQLTAMVGAPRCAAALRDAVRVPVLDSWQELIPDDVAEAIIVVDDAPDTLEAARQLAAVNKKILVWPTSGQGSIFVYQLTLIHAEQTLVLVPLLPLRSHPEVARVKALFDSDEIGRIQHLRIDAVLKPERGAGYTPRQLGERFLADIDLLRMLGGSYDQMSASRSASDEISIDLATATLTGETCPQALWSLAAGPADHWKLTVAAEKGTFLITADGEPLQTPATLTAMGTVPAPPESGGPASDWAEALLDGCEGLEKPSLKTPLPDWSDLAQLYELEEAFAKSLERRRTIDIQFDAPSERSVFKSQMAAAGCSVLIYTLVASAVFLLISQAVPMPAMARHALRVLVFLPVGVFLALQSLIFLTRPSR